MHPQHNPIAQRIDEMRRLWTEKVKPDTTLVRWLLKPEDSRMYEGFCRLEASPHGTLNELFIFFYTPFESAAAYSRDIALNWIAEVKSNSEQKEALRKRGVAIDDWDADSYEKQLQKKEADADAVLLEMLTAYRNLLPQKDVPLVLALLPQSTASVGGFALWLKNMAAQGIPQNLRLLVFDHTDGNYWGKVFETFSDTSVTLHHDLRMNDAIRQIATGGNPQAPEVQFRKCLYEMGDAAQKKQSAQLKQWGQKAIDVATKSGQKDLLATAYISYAGMLFGFKDYVTIHTLLDSGMRVCKTAIAAGNEAMSPLLLQFYGFKAAAHQQQKETKEALRWFLKEGDEAGKAGLFLQSVSAYYKAFLLAQYKGLVNEQVAALASALHHTPHLGADEIRVSEYPYAAYDYVEMVRHKTPETEPAKAEAVNEKMVEVFGEGWRETVAQMKLNFNKQHVQMTEAKANTAV